MTPQQIKELRESVFPPVSNKPADMGKSRNLFAAKIGATHRSVTAWEQGTRSPKKDTVDKMEKLKKELES